MKPSCIGYVEYIYGDPSTILSQFNAASASLISLYDNAMSAGSGTQPDTVLGLTCSGHGH
jgi:hypothetical protein